MKNKILVLLFAIFLVGLVPQISPVGEFTYCCEKTVDGFWCQNLEDKGQCEVGNNFHDPAPTSCEATSYCKMGCCFNSQEGTCLPNVPQRVCQDEGGVWEADADCNVPQCSLGCCEVGDQAAFVTLTRCKRLSYLYGLEINFRIDILNEPECLATATSGVKGACVFDKEYEKTCRILSQKECTGLESNTTDVSFHEGYLCSAEALGTNCGPTQKTTCLEGREEVYYLDSCGNLANIYDADKHNDKEYWTYMKGKEESCGYENINGNAGSAKCGNCDYFLGSTCKAYDRNQDKKPTYGNNICRDLACEYEGKRYEHGETWCAKNTKLKDVPGSEYYRLVCFNNEVTVEPCAAFRQETCIETEVNGFKYARCRANLWRDCLAQDNQKDCENTEMRDCDWINSGSKIVNKSGTFDIFVCTPSYTPGLDFWNEEGEADEICSASELVCTAKFEKTGWDYVTGKTKWQCVENCYCCVNDENHEGCIGDKGGKWDYHEGFCEALGDCGTKKNYIEIKGWQYDEPLITVE